MEKNYCIKQFYRSRKEYFHYDDTSEEDNWQLEVYLHALGLMKKNNLQSIIDVGCGSAYKLVTYFDDYDTIGLEVPENVEWLKEKYPNKKWMIADFSQKTDLHADIVICSDVIEHIVDPDDLIDYIKNISFRFLVISTPDRSLLYKPWNKGFWGPPGNPAHQREWSFKEFYKYMASNFNVIDHRVTNLAQWTQMIICQKRG